MKNKNILIFLIFFSIVFCQKSWFKGNLKGIDDLSFELNIKGVNDDVWKQRVYSYVKLKLLENDIQILETLIPKLVIDINILDSRVEKVSSFFVQISVYGYSVSESEYYKSFSDLEISKNLMTSIIFSHSIIGQTNSSKLYKDIEKNIDKTVALFLNQWYKDNPSKQF
ncbi:MAG: hypothetical protein CMG55_06390 [Candidatus Marinimicrobia bacterium]|nr:hypothetical protein [Candidatus Neomarinimicrobiota bacterium]|tara:strand:- start:423 stop:926 length:504 start_codon:yes stop_codon:yes gene_type:complete